MDVPIEDIAAEFADMLLGVMFTSVTTVNERSLADFERGAQGWVGVDVSLDTK